MYVYIYTYINIHTCIYIYPTVSEPARVISPVEFELIVFGVPRIDALERALLRIHGGCWLTCTRYCH